MVPDHNKRTKPKGSTDRPWYLVIIDPITLRLFRTWFSHRSAV